MAGPGDGDDQWYQALWLGAQFRLCSLLLSWPMLWTEEQDGGRDEDEETMGGDSWDEGAGSNSPGRQFQFLLVCDVSTHVESFTSMSIWMPQRPDQATGTLTWDGSYSSPNVPAYITKQREYKRQVELSNRQSFKKYNHNLKNVPPPLHLQPHVGIVTRLATFASENIEALAEFHRFRRFGSRLSQV
jgi:hypothetical protein